MKRFSVFFLVVFSVLLTVAAVSAGPPVRVEGDIDELNELADCNDYGVGDFTIVAHTVGSEVEKYFYDEDDNMVRYSRRTNGSDVVYRTDDPDNFITGRYVDNQTITFDPDTGEETSTSFAGTPWNLHLPGQGNIFHISGPLFLDGEGNFVKEAGLVVVDYLALCNYFAS